MDIFFELSKKIIFSLSDLDIYYKNRKVALKSLNTMIKNGLIVRIRKDMYTCISNESGEPIANRYQIASQITTTSCVSNHSAMEYYGYCDQVYYDVYVSSCTRFEPFEFNGYSYQYVSNKYNFGIETIPYSGGIKITDKERTLIDSIKNLDKISGIEEVLTCIRSYSSINEKKLLEYLKNYNNQFLYQKTGYILENMKREFSISDSFFDTCLSHIGKSKRYLTNDYKNGVMNNKWNLIIPKNILNLKNGE